MAKPRVLKVPAPGWHPGARGTVTHKLLPGMTFTDCFYRHAELVKWLADNDLPQKGTLHNGKPVQFKKDPKDELHR